MTYCTLADVNKMLIGTQINDNSLLTADTVNTDILPRCDRYIDDKLGKFYQTPITGEDALVTINRIATYWSAAEVTQRIYIGQTPANSPQAATWRKYADQDLQDIIAGNILLPDAVPTADTPKPRSHLVKDKLSQPTWNEPPRFSMGKRF
jgi:hypothetical protein